MPTREQPFILIAEDSDDDVMMLRRAFAHAGITTPLHFVSNGDEAIAYLSGKGKFANRDEYPLPDLFLLDLKMPRKNGFEVLEWMRDRPALARLRVVVLTTSEEIRDVNRAYKLGAASFLVKPLDFNEFRNMLSAMHDYWMSHNQIPETERPSEANGAERKNGPAPK